MCEIITKSASLLNRCTFVIIIGISTRKTKVMLEIPAFVNEFLWIVAHTKTVFIQEVLNMETQLHQSFLHSYDNEGDNLVDPKIEH